MYKRSKLSYFENTDLIYTLYINNHNINNLFMQINYLYDHMFLLITGKDINDIVCYTGLTQEGIKTMTILDWTKHLEKSCKEFLIEEQKINDIEYESDDLLKLCLQKKDEFNKSMKIYMKKKNLMTLNNYFDIGYFDIWELSDGIKKVAINIKKEKIISI
jgi:hypothetical protein